MLLILLACAPQRETRVAEVLEWNAELPEDLRQAKYCKMAESPHAFFRGANHLFWEEHLEDPRLEAFGGDLRTGAWLQGDLHALNYGSFHDDDGRIVYDLNDFDEVLVEDYQLDLWHLAISVELLSRELRVGDVRALPEAYRESMGRFQGTDRELQLRLDADSAWGRVDDFLEDVERLDRDDMLEEWTEGAELAHDSKLEALDDETWERVAAALDHRYRVLDVARRLDAGTGSLGVERFYVLVDDGGRRRILDLKEQGEPSALAFAKPEYSDWFEGAFDSPAERVVVGHKALAHDVDDHLDNLEIDGLSLTVRELSPWKKSFPLAELDSDARFEKLVDQWAYLAAGAHARSDRDHDEDWLPYSLEDEVLDRIGDQSLSFDRLVVDVAIDGADQMEAEHEALVEWLEDSCE